MTLQRYRVLTANAILVIFPVLTAHLVREYASTAAAVDFLLVLSFINSLGLLDLGTTRSVLIGQDRPGRWRDVLFLFITFALAAVIIVQPKMSSELLLLVMVGITYWAGSLFKSLLERRLRLEREFIHRLGSAAIILSAAVILVMVNYVWSLIWLIAGKVIIVAMLGSGELTKYFRESLVPRINLTIAGPAILASVIINADRVAVARLFEGQAAADYLFFCLVFQKGLGVFASILPTYLRHGRLALQDLFIPLAFTVVTVIPVFAYAIEIAHLSTDDSFLWLALLAVGYGLNVLTVPYIGRNLFLGMHRQLFWSYAAEVAIMVGIILFVAESIKGIALAVVVRSALDFVVQWRIGSDRTQSVF